MATTTTIEPNLPIHSASVSASIDGSVVGRNDAERAEDLNKKRKKTNLFSVIIGVALIASFAFQFLAMGLNRDKKIVLIAGIAGCIVTGTSGVKQYILQRMDTLRCVHNKIRSEVNRFMEENNKLSRNVDGLETHVGQLQVVEKELENIAESQNTSAEELVSLVKENGEIVKEQKALAKAELQEGLLATILRTDRNGDLKIDEREANILILRLKNHGGIDFDEDRVRDALIKTNGSLPSLLRIIREVGDEDDKRNEVKMLNIDDDKFMDSVRENYSSRTVNK